MSLSTRVGLVAVAASFGLSACGGSSAPTAPSNQSALTQVVSVSPAGAAVNVSTTGPIMIGFSHAMHAGAEMYMSLHVGTATGAAVTGHATWSADSMHLTFMPTAPLAAHSAYVLHLGGGMMDDAGQAVDLRQCTQFGGQAGTTQMMSGGMMGGSEMGAGWQTPGTNTYGMIFTFITA